MNLNPIENRPCFPQFFITRHHKNAGDMFWNIRYDSLTNMAVVIRSETRDPLDQTFSLGPYGNLDFPAGEGFISIKIEEMFEYLSRNDPKKDENLEEFSNGWNSRTKGLVESDCPYINDGDSENKYKMWHIGWKCADVSTPVPGSSYFKTPVYPKTYDI